LIRVSCLLVIQFSSAYRTILLPASHAYQGTGHD
jgi:hypothetical protein